MGVYDIARNRLKSGGFAYLVENILGYPMRTIRNAKNAARQKALLNSIISADIPKDLVLSNKEMPEVVVSLTSYPKRFPGLPLCIKSILLQDMLPDKIIVYLGSDTKVEDITQAMRELEIYGVEYRLDPYKNLRPHKKYFYAMQEYPDSLVITVDDDLIYPTDMIRSLLSMHELFPEAVCARRTHVMRFNLFGNLRPYETWKKGMIIKSIPSFSLMAVGCGGVLYPPKCLHEKAFDTKTIENICLGADDIWLKCMEILADTKVVYVPSDIAFAEVPGSQEEALKNENTGVQGKNDKYLIAVMDYFGIRASDFRNDKKRGRET